jgi:hypothetical protein
MARGFGDSVSSVLRHENRPGLFDAVYADLAAAQRPTVLIFEDVHWADETTLDLMRFLGRRLGTVPALVLATYRDDETGRDHPLRSRLGDLATQSAVSRMALAPLSLDAVTTLAGRSNVDASRIWARTGGNAFFVTEVLQAASEAVPRPWRMRCSPASDGCRRQVNTPLPPLLFWARGPSVSCCLTLSAAIPRPSTNVSTPVCFSSHRPFSPFVTTSFDTPCYPALATRTDAG